MRIYSSILVDFDYFLLILYMPFFALEFIHSEKYFAYGVFVLDIFLLCLLLDIDETLVPLCEQGNNIQGHLLPC
jgi:hypothetical protein